ncbi:MAG: DUF3253 domain-containing protein [Ardenticatenaceae bacterium]|nr:DUF3253 domain-containing protein [Anaerolineales bacterium]MCB8922520.1 DUF3253 domain-containing protein [Ardenticatenaceae bacterium]
MATERVKKPRKVSDEEVYETIIHMCREAGLAGSVRPEDVARVLLPEHWQTILKRVRLFSKKLAQNGRIFILRKGKPADPDDFRGLIRLQITEAGLLDDEEE